MTDDFEVVPDFMRSRTTSGRGRKPSNPLSRALLNEQTVRVAKERSWGSLYKLAKSHGMQAHVHKIEKGFIVWFEKLEE